jgi:hypothetical protein
MEISLPGKRHPQLLSKSEMISLGCLVIGKKVQPSAKSEILNGLTEKSVVGSGVEMTTKFFWEQRLEKTGEKVSIKATFEIVRVVTVNT